jgi:ABC-type multidrug transport system permease subunit
LKLILNLIKKEYILFWNDKVALSLTFLVPAALILLFGSIFGGSGSNVEGIRLAFLNQSDSKIGNKIESTLDTTKAFSLIKTYINDDGKEVKFDTTSIKDFVRKGNSSAALVVPKDAYSDTSFGLMLKFYYDPKNELEMQITQGLLQQTIMTQIPEIFNSGMIKRSQEYLGKDSGLAFTKKMASVIGEYFDVDTSKILKSWFGNLNDTTIGDSSAKKVSEFFKNIVNINKQQLVGENINNPGATRSVGGWAIMFLLFSITASGSSLFEEKQSGVTLRILASPVSRLDILWGKYLYNISLGVIQLITLFFAGYIFFGIDIFSNFFNLLLIIIAASAAATSFGMVLAAISKTPAQGRGLGTFLILTMSAIGGAWFPTFILPPFIQTLSKLTIVYWTMEGFLNVLWRGSGLVELLPIIGILLLMSLIINIVSIYRFKKGDIF